MMRDVRLSRLIGALSFFVFLKERPIKRKFSNSGHSLKVG